ncbi:RNA polymerase factor sigma-54 [Aureimonas sp. AU12]|uniref:RNA polymerase factor sigma-54 n=1 Tax=Aureimonas sp. AU12 TaxID=1638161 RepID=UPI0007858C7C|nr:RNA polymerase factor sigma-54 [Aureimonas sp. AU12]
MNLSVNLQIRQSQQLVMTPQLLQSIRLLQFHHAELQAFLEREAEANPIIEIAAGVEAGEPVGPSDQDAPALPPGEASEAPLTGASADGAAFADGSDDGIAPHADDPDAFLPALRSLGESERSGGFDGADPIETAGSGPHSLHAHALAEISDVFADPTERRLAEVLFADLDAAGYLGPGTAERAQALGLAPDATEALLARLQAQAEPAGLFARTLAECLAVQLRRQNRFDPVIAAVLDHLPLLARRDFAALARITGEDEAGLMEILGEIRRLDPRPGAGLSPGEAEPVLPDVVVRPAAGGEGWQVDLNADAFPRILVHQQYAQEVLRGAASTEERSFLAQCQQNATWLTRSLDQRARTILKVAVEIVRRQDRFLSEGVSGLRPMTLMDVAEAIGMHESTVSRVTANKYVATPRGTFEMKFFFTVSIASSDGGDAHSAESVKLRIGRMIAGERPGAVLSDDDIAAALKSDGIDLARRTVAKYREALGLPSSVQRRREMNARRLAG